MLQVGTIGMNQEDEFKLSEFRTGAFVSLKPILPVIIKYAILIIKIQMKEDTMIHIITNINNLNYKIKVLDPIYPEKHDTIEKV